MWKDQLLWSSGIFKQNKNLISFFPLCKKIKALTQIDVKHSLYNLLLFVFIVLRLVVNICLRWLTSLRPSLVPTNQSDMQHATEPPPILLYNNSTVLVEEYEERLSVSEKRVTLHSVRITDEGSFTVMDRTGKVRRRNCLNVRGDETDLSA